MLNRIFIVVGVLAIVALGSAFIVPRFIQWGDYRGRMEELAAGVVGADVSIRGDIAFSLLPQPQLRFADVVVGAPDAPTVTVDVVEAEFSLVDFLRDRYTITRLVLERPSLDLKIDGNGLIHADLALPQSVTQSTVSIANAQIVNGRLGVADARSGDSVALEAIGGELRLGSLRGPFQFQGAGMWGAERYAVRFNSASPDASGASRVSGFVRPERGGFSVATEGSLTGGAEPRYEGSLTYRQSPPPVEGGDAARGDLVLEGQLTANSGELTLTTYTIVPDENRAGTRLTGAASLSLAASRSFQAVVSGGVLSLPPRDATVDQSSEPYELVRLLAELPTPTIVPIAGTVNVDIAEVDLRALALRDVRLDAVSDGKSWRIDHFGARLAGDTNLMLQGQLSALEARPSFTGRLSLETRRPDAFAQIWRDAEDTRPLLNMPARLDANVALAGDELNLTAVHLLLDQTVQTGSATVSFGPERRLDLAMDFDALGPGESAAVAALLPDFAGSGDFAVSFPQGALAVTAKTATVLGLNGRTLAAEADWTGNGVALRRVAAEDLGGVRFDVSGNAAGTLAAPVLSGKGTIGVQSPTAPALAALYASLSAQPGVQALIGRSLPANLDVELTAPGTEGGQHLLASGAAGPSSISLDAQLSTGLLTSLSSPISVVLNVSAPTGDVLTQQLGLGKQGLIGAAVPVELIVAAEGSSSTGIELRMEATSPGERLGFVGDVVVAAPSAVSAEGRVSGALSDGSGLLSLLAGTALPAPPIEGAAEIVIDAAGSIALTDMEGLAAGQAVSGELRFDRAGGANALTGAIEIASLDMSALPIALGGPVAAARLDVNGLWPDGPFDLGATSRQTTGTVRVHTPSVLAGGKPFLSDTSFEYAWDQEAVRLRGLRGMLGAGTVEADVGMCCAGPQPAKQVTGRVSLAGVALDAVLPATPASVLEGTLDLGVQVEGTGADFSQVVQNLSGEGSLTARDLSVAQFGPGVFTTVGELPNVLDLPADALTGIAAMALQSGTFTAQQVSGPFTIGAGTGRLANVALDAPGAKLFGNASLRLSDLGLGGSFALTPVGLADANGLITEATSQITVGLSGTLSAPERSIDLQALVDAVQLRANELELDRLDALRLEDEARSRAAAEERNRLIAEQQRQREAEEAARGAEEERLAAEAEQQRRAEEEAAARRVAPIPAPRFQPAPQPVPAPQPLTVPPAPTAPPSQLSPGALDLTLPSLIPPP